MNVDNNQMENLKQIKHELTRFMMIYRFALEEMETKIEILKQEFQILHDYSPIEHTKSRIKSPESIMSKMLRKNSELSLAAVKSSIKDIMRPANHLLFYLGYIQCQ